MTAEAGLYVEKCSPLSVTRLLLPFLLGKKSPKFLEHFYPPTYHTLMQAASDTCFMKTPEHVVTGQTKIFKLVMLAQKFPQVHSIFL